jgi:hypothetical protein
MIDPKNITNFNRTVDQLQEFLLFSIVVAGKNSKIQAQKLDDFLGNICADFKDENGHLPKNYFEALRWSASFEDGNILIDNLREVRMGQYARITKAFKSVSEIRSLETISLDELVKIQGIGPKTARFFLLHSREGMNCAVLDTHILKYLRDMGYEKIPKSTPQDPKKYRKLELAFVQCWHIHQHCNWETPLSLAQFDLKIWKKYSQ